MDKEEFISKIEQFEGLIEELAHDIKQIYSEGQEMLYRKVMMRLIRALERSQTMVRESFELHVEREKAGKYAKYTKS